MLLVDDDEPTREVVGAMLEAVGLSVRAVDGGEAALDFLARDPFDLALLDLSMPGMSGLELCRQIRRAPSLRALPVIFLTAHAEPQRMMEAFACGADDYVVKPFRAPELGARIFGLLRRAKARPQAVGF